MFRLLKEEIGFYTTQGTQFQIEKSRAKSVE
jgi:hypothetical protein